MSQLPFQIKICGVTNLQDASVAIEHRADALGLNFYPKSKRCIASDDAAAIVAAHSSAAPLVGVFVNQSADEIATAHAASAFAWIQLHGDESPDVLREVKAKLRLPRIRAFRWNDAAATFIDSYLQDCSDRDCLPEAILIDSFKAGEFGGTGHVADWRAIATWRDQSDWKMPLVLAGGLTPHNVADAIGAVRPDAVDTASGVEQSPRRKDPNLVRRFIAAARAAFAALPPR